MTGTACSQVFAERSSTARFSGSGGQDGLALIATLVALSLLMALGLPFVLSMGMGEEVSYSDVDRQETQLAAESVREIVLNQAAGTHEGVDPTPLVDGRQEYPGHLDLPPGFEALTNEGRLRLAGEVWDLQRKIHVNTASPLVLGNLLGLVTRVREDFKEDATALVLDDTSSFPDQGYVLVDGELIRYEANDGGTLTGLSRGLLYPTYVAATGHNVRSGELVYDYRLIRAVIHPFTDGSTVGVAGHQAYRSVGEIAASGSDEFGFLTEAEIDLLERHCEPATPRTVAAKFGRPERVFQELQGGESRHLIVKSAFHLGAGATVRLRSLQNPEQVEYAFVESTERMRQRVGDLQLPETWRLRLLEPVVGSWPAMDTVVEPMVPHPVNINTADPAVIYALLANLGRERNARLNEQELQQGSTVTQPPLSPSETRDLVDRILTVRGDFGPGDGEETVGPFDGWEDFSRRVILPLAADLGSTADKQRWVTVYRALRVGHDGSVNMGTMPLTFRSGPLVGYRAGSSRSRSRLSTDNAERVELTGRAYVMPEHELARTWSTQLALEEAFRLDRQAPFFLTGPINTGTPTSMEAGTSPAPRFGAHLWAKLFPNFGLGVLRYPANEETQAQFEPMTSRTPFRFNNRQFQFAHESNMLKPDPRGHDVNRQGPYRMGNIGGTGDGSPPQTPGGDHSRTYFPFTGDGGVHRSYGCSFWVHPESLGGTGVFDIAADDPDRNRMTLQLRENQLFFEIYDEAGLDPNPTEGNGTSPERSVTSWVVPISEMGLRPNVPFHVAFSGFSSRPGGMSLLVDGIPRGQPRYVTYLAAPLQVFDPQNRDPGLRPSENPRYDLDILVENTEHFPERGVLRIGLELFEYTSKGGNSFSCRFVDSIGGRAARMALREWRPDIPVDGQGRPTVNLNDPSFTTVNLDVAPEHPVGAAVELYGYAAPISRDSIVQPGEGSLQGSLGAFAVARCFKRSGMDTITVSTPQGATFNLGQGIIETNGSDLELADPLVTQNSYPPDAASDNVLGAFQETGGFALIMQYERRFNAQLGSGGGLSGQTESVGGIELIQYTGRQGNRLTGISRAVSLDGPTDNQGLPLFDGTPRKFVFDWENNLRIRIADEPIPFDDLPFFMCYVVPISIKVDGTFIDPSNNQIDGINQSEWVQIYTESDESLTEWVRYDLIQDGSLIRANRRAWNNAHYQLTRQLTIEDTTINNLGVELQNPFAANEATYGTVQADIGYIGAIDQIEETFPQINRVRNVLGFRGDPFTGTSSHAQPGNSSVLQCHRLELFWGNYGALGARAGRNDRVAFAKGRTSGTASAARPEWHTVNWVARRFNGDTFPQQGQIVERLGPFPFQLVALKRGVGQLFEGPEELDDFADARFSDRMLKFPSGELPSTYPQDGLFGGSVFDEVAPVTGIVDEISAVAHRTPSLILDQAMDDSAMEFIVRADLRLLGFGPVIQGNQTGNYPQAGGLVMIDNEILAYSAHGAGQFTVAVDGRGLLGTEPRGHDEGARVHFLTHVPAAILNGGVGNRDWTFQLQGLGNLPTLGGTVLVGRTELAHYTWTRVQGDSGGSLEMPRWFDPDDPEGQPEGLLRGRFGSQPISAASGSPVIWFPFRYWDRFHERSDDPELSHFQMTLEQSPVLFTALDWEEETQDALVDVECLTRVDERGAWFDDPERTQGLFLFDKSAGRDDFLPMFRQGAQIELRFRFRYRNGAFDPVTGLAQAWKTAPVFRDVTVEYQGESRIVEERVTAR